MTLAKGAKIGAYEISGVLGAGGMGEVYRARDPRLKRDVAIKIVPAAFCSGPQRLRRFEQEAHAAASVAFRLTNPCISVYRYLNERLSALRHRGRVARGRYSFRTSPRCWARFPGRRAAPGLSQGGWWPEPSVCGRLRFGTLARHASGLRPDASRVMLLRGAYSSRS